MIIHDCTQGSDEWHKLRLGKLTASHAQAIATGGKGLETLCRKLACEIYTGSSEETYSNQNMITGVEEESFARMAFELETGLNVEQVGFIEYSELVGCSPDGLIGTDLGIEIKRKTFSKHAELLLGGSFEPQYIWQVYMNMLITERDSWYLVSYNPKFKSKSLFVEQFSPDEERYEKLLNGFEKGEKLIKDYLETLNN